MLLFKLCSDFDGFLKNNKFVHLLSRKKDRRRNPENCPVYCTGRGKKILKPAGQSPRALSPHYLTAMSMEVEWLCRSFSDTEDHHAPPYPVSFLIIFTEKISGVPRAPLYVLLFFVFTTDEIFPATDPIQRDRKRAYIHSLSSNCRFFFQWNERRFRLHIRQRLCTSSGIPKRPAHICLPFRISNQNWPRRTKCSVQPEDSCRMMTGQKRIIDSETKGEPKGRR